jgi:hypothetical protein
MRAVLAIVPLLVACDNAAPTPPPASAPTQASAPAPAASDLPPPPRYVGRWAARASECTTAWWRFWADELRTNVGEMRCDILPPDADMGDERRRAVCVAEGAVKREQWVMTYPADGLMTLSRDGAPPVTLGKCA